jgi:hypothetical protein
MAISLSKFQYVFGWATIFSVVLCSSARAQSDVNRRAERVVESICFIKDYGGYTLHSTLPDGRLRLIAEAHASGIWTLELLLTPDEVKEIWLTSLTTILLPKEIERIERFCNTDNTILKSAIAKENDEISRPRLNQILKERMPGFPDVLSSPAMKLTPTEQKALEEFRSNPELMDIQKKLSVNVRGLVWQKYRALGDRVRHISLRHEDLFLGSLMHPAVLSSQ